MVFFLSPSCLGEVSANLDGIQPPKSSLFKEGNNGKNNHN